MTGPSPRIFKILRPNAILKRVFGLISRAAPSGAGAAHGGAVLAFASPELRSATRHGGWRLKPDGVTQLHFGNACRREVVLNGYNLASVAVAYLESF
jgi:hypothetical protein